MKRIQKQLLTLLALMGISSGLVAYEFDFMNTTEEFVVLKFNTRSASNVDRYAILPPGGSTKFPVANLDCFEKVSWAPFKKVDGWGNPIPFNGGLDLVNRTPDAKNPKRAIGRIEGKDSKGNDKQRLFGDQIAPAYSFYRMDVIMIPNEIFDKTVEAAEKLCSGISDAMCQAIDGLKTLIGAPTAGGSNTPTETPTATSTKTPTTPKEPVSNNKDKNSLVIAILNNIKEMVLDKGFTIQEKNTQIKDLMDSNKVLLKEKLTPVEFSSIGRAYTPSLGNDATKNDIIKVVDQIIIKLNTSTKLDLDSSVIRTAMDMDMDFSSLLSSPNPAPGSKTPANAPKNCEYGLAKIAGAAGTIAGISLCKARQFQIAYTAQKGNPDLMQFEGFSSVPKLQLITGVGE